MYRVLTYQISGKGNLVANEICEIFLGEVKGSEGEGGYKKTGNNHTVFSSSNS